MPLYFLPGSPDSDTYPGPDLRTGPRYNVNVWADGFGLWHASVPLTADERADARAARRLILAELSARDAHLARSAVKVERERVTGHGTAIYREVAR